ncbi:MAG: hypothetical protein NW206_19585 [Hyphomonadaceae bacterium]|nr:hypothetical protein [Hyphomonadaceae bacterium]
MPADKRIFETRPQGEPGSGKAQLNATAAAAAVLSRGAEGGAKLRPSLAKRLVFAAVGAGLGVAVLAGMALIALGVRFLGVWAVLALLLVLGGAAVGWASAAQHVLRHGRAGWPKPPRV